MNAPAKKPAPNKLAASETPQPDSTDKPENKSEKSSDAKRVPKLGDIVLMLVNPGTNNGSDVAPAVVVRVWSDRCVNLKVLTDEALDKWQTSVNFVDERPEDDYEVEIDENSDEVQPRTSASSVLPRVCFFPPN